MSATEVTAYFKAQGPVKQATLEAMRKILLEIEPKLEQTIAWKSAMFKFNGRNVVGLCAHNNHMSFSMPQSDILLNSKDLNGYVVYKGSFQYPVNKPLPKKLVSKLVKARLAEIKANS